MQPLPLESKLVLSIGVFCVFLFVCVPYLVSELKKAFKNHLHRRLVFLGILTLGSTILASSTGKIALSAINERKEKTRQENIKLRQEAQKQTQEGWQAFLNDLEKRTTTFGNHSYVDLSYRKFPNSNWGLARAQVCARFEELHPEWECYNFETQWSTHHFSIDGLAIDHRPKK